MKTDTCYGDGTSDFAAFCGDDNSVTTDTESAVNCAVCIELLGPESPDAIPWDDEARAERQQMGLTAL